MEQLTWTDYVLGISFAATLGILLGGLAGIWRK